MTIEWWLLQGSVVPVFHKREGQLALVVGMEGDTIVAVTKPSLLIIPTFELPNEDLEGRIENLLKALVMAGKNMNEVEGKLYGVAYATSGMGLVRLGLAYSVETLQQVFKPNSMAAEEQQAIIEGRDFSLMSPVECLVMHLPTCS